MSLLAVHGAEKAPCAPFVLKNLHDHVRVFQLETIHFSEINTLRYMKLLSHCRDQYLRVPAYPYAAILLHDRIILN